MQQSVKQRIEGNWDQIRGEIKKTWGRITDNDLKRAEGNWDKLVGIIKERTGDSLAVVEEKLEKLTRRN